MDVWFTWCRRPATCCYCKEQVETTTPMVVKKMWRKGDENSRRVNLIFYYHPLCHYVEGLDYLMMHPYTCGEKRGPKQVMQLTPEDARSRYLLLRKKASLEQRKRELKAHFPDRELHCAQIDLEIMSVWTEIAQVGGIPKSWLK